MSNTPFKIGRKGSRYIVVSAKTERQIGNLSWPLKLEEANSVQKVVDNMNAAYNAGVMNTQHRLRRALGLEN